MKILAWIFSLLGCGTLIGLVIEPISRSVRNITLGIHAQDWATEEEDQVPTHHSLTIGLFFIRCTFEFEYDYEEEEETT